MTGYSYRSTLGLVDPGEITTVWTPNIPRRGRAGVVLLHGSGSPTEFVDIVTQPASVLLANSLANAGIPCIASEFGGDKWGNNTVMTGILTARTILDVLFDVGSRIIVLGVSAGAPAAARFSQLNPTLTAAVVGIIPAYDIKYEYQNIPGTVAAIEAAWGFVGIGAFPAAADIAANYIPAIGVPLRTGYSSDDPIVPPAPVISYYNSVAGTPSNLINLGAFGHSNTAVGQFSIPNLINFLYRNGA